LGKNFTVLHNVNLIDMSGKGLRIKKNRIVVINNGRIRSVAGAQDLQALKNSGYFGLDCGGNYLIPGLIDLHVHCTNPFIDPGEAVKYSTLLSVQKQVVKNLQSCIRGGVTTIRDMGAPPAILRFRRKIERGSIIGPRIVSSLSMISCPGGYPDMVPAFKGLVRMLLGGQFAERVVDEKQAEKTVHTLVDRGAEWIKIVHQEQSYMSGNARLSVLSDGSYAAVARTARARKRKIALHALSVAGYRKGIELPVDTIEHLPLEELSLEDVRMIAAKGITVVPTFLPPGLYLDNMLPVLRDIIIADGDRLVPDARGHILATIEQITAGKQGGTLIDYPYLRKNFSFMAKNLRRLRKAGVRIGFGTDAGGTDTCLFGLPWLEMQFMSDAGMSNYEILETATRINAEILGLDSEIGSIEEGKSADMVLLEGDPIKDIRNAGRVKRVWKNGLQV
jgi:imidazolonepropionase-like amidohydrolase